ncbi:MAG: exodeoxyribonuclease V subunit gamma [Euryarchaeota archaeon]|nr:exodeoxyribonuclease V subunit gamma [Euryarchaeota archaeon]
MEGLDQQYSRSTGRGLVLFGSNDPEELVNECVRQLGNPLSDPFKEEEFLVQSRGLGIWLQLKIAEKKGIFAHARFRFQEEAIWMILRGFLGGGPERNPYTKEGLAWKIFGLLPGLMHQNSTSFQPLVEYLGSASDWDGNRAFRLCRQIATLYDSYLTYRPEMILDWNDKNFPDDRDRWQGILWHALRKSLDFETLPEKVEQLKQLEAPKRADWLPERLSVFGVSTMPPLFLDVLQAYGEFRSLKIFSLQPAPVFWGEVESEKWKLRALKRATLQAGHPVDENSLSDRAGNALIGSLGKTGREFFNMLVDRNAHDEPLTFREPKGNRLLARLQRWIFDALNESQETRTHPRADDPSLVINSCHGNMREVEVLRDYLLRRFEEDPSLKPRDVLVMMPTPEDYAPYIRAVFSGLEEGMPREFPYSIVDREPRRESHLIDYLFDLLDFFEGRATNREVLDLMDSLPSRTKNEWEDADMEIFRQWIGDCHAYWGFSAEHRERCGSTATHEHTWRHALDRMALGFCFRGYNRQLWEGTLPYDEIEGEHAIRFSKFSRFLSALADFEKQARGQQSLLDWSSWLTRLTNEFFHQTDATLLDRRKINEAVESLASEYHNLAGEGKVPLRVIRYHLGNVLEVGSPQGRFLTQGVTFSGLRPMRSVSARVVCILGLNAEAFPRQNRAPSFDLSGDRRPGDRSSREDDRYLFLETLWCAKDFLYLSYVGQSIRQSQEIPPSIVINELLDALDEIAEWKDSEGNPIPAVDAVVKKQTLHPFGPDNYRGDRLPLSYSLPNLKAGRALLDSKKTVNPFVDLDNRQVIEDSKKDLSVGELVEFFSNPCKAYLKYSLGMKLWEEEASPPDFEPLEIESLEKYKLMGKMLNVVGSGKDISALYELEKAEGRLPPGNLGEVWFGEAEREVSGFLDQWQSLLVESSGDSLIFEEIFDGLLFRGEVPPLRNGKHVLFRCSKKFNGKDRVRLWIEHLCGCAASGTEPFESLFVCNDKKYLHAQSVPADQAKMMIQELLQIRKSGLQIPLPFFPNSSFAYFEKINDAGLKNDSTEGEIEQAKKNALVEAKKAWAGASFKGGEVPGDGKDFSVQTCFGKSPFGDPQFANLSEFFFRNFDQFVEERS